MLSAVTVIIVGGLNIVMPLCSSLTVSLVVNFIIGIHSMIANVGRFLYIYLLSKNFATILTIISISTEYYGINYFQFRELMAWG